MNGNGSIGNRNGNGNGNGNGFHKTGSFLERLFNISRREWPRVLFCFAISLFPKIGFVIGWTALTAMFIATYGIAFLPTLFILNAILLIIGSFFYTRLLNRGIRKENLMIGSVVFASIFLFFATLFPEKSIPFFTSIIFAQAIFLSQLAILTHLFTEDQFSPLESERTFPFIESAETIGSILGGFIIGSVLSKFPISSLFVMWIVLAFFVIPMLFAYRYLIPRFPFVPFAPKSPAEKPYNIGNIISGFQKKPFLKSLFIVVLTQWVIFNMLEFQYTKAVSQRVTTHEEQTLVKVPQSRIFHVSLLTDPTGLTTSKEVFHALPKETLASQEEQKLALTLGKLHMLFGGLALFTHLFLASRFLQAFGIVRSMLIHPLFLFGSFIFLFLKFGFLSAVVTKANFEVGHSLFRNSYHASFYAFPEGFRGAAKEFLEGVVRPFGVIMGMGSLLLFHFFWMGKELTLAINLAMVLALFYMATSIFKLKKAYTDLSKQNLLHPRDESEKWTAIEILCQKGHEKPEEIFMEALENFSQNTLVSMYLLKGLGKLKNPKVIPTLLDGLEDSRPEIRYSALSALEQIPLTKNGDLSQAFSKYRMVSSLKDLFHKENAISIRGRVIRLFSRLHEREAVEFILKNLSHENSDVLAHCIVACGKSRDPGIVYYLEPFLEAEHPRVKASTVSALFQFPWLRHKTEEVLQELLASETSQKIISALEACGEIREGKFKKMLRKYLHHDDDSIRFEAALSLSRMDDRFGMETLSEELMRKYDPEKWQRFLHCFHCFSHDAERAIQKIISRKFSEKLHHLNETVPMEEWHELPASTLSHLKAAYELLSRPEEANRLEKIISRSS